jgi:TRAP-type transport system periplasmic protein
VTSRLALCCLLAALGCSEQRTAEYTLRFGSPYPPGHPFSRADRAWMEHVVSASNGRLAIQPFWSGSLLSAEQSLIELRHGIGDLGVISPIYARGGAHALRLQSGFYAGALTFDTQVAVYKCLARQFPVFDRELTGLRVLAVQGGSLPGVLTRKHPVRTLEDLKGLRLRAPAELIEVLKTLGADPLNMPMGEVYSALAKGVIDGVVAPADTLRALHFADVAQYFTGLAIPRGAYPSRAISDAALARLPDDLQRLLLESTPFWEDALEREVGQAAQLGERFGHEQGVQFLAVAASEQQRFEAAYNAAAESSVRHFVQPGVDARAIFTRAQVLVQQLASPLAAGGDPCSG